MNINKEVDFEMFGESSDILDSLFESITEEEVKELNIEIENNNFSITSDEQANFFLRRLEEISSEKDKINNTCNNEIERFTARVNNFRAKEILSLENTERYFCTLLESYARLQLEGSKKKSIKLPFGTMSFKKSPTKIVYDDEILMKFIKEHNLNDFIRIKEEINKKDLKSQLTIKDDGTVVLDDKVVEGVSTMPGETTFSVK